MRRRMNGSSSTTRTITLSSRDLPGHALELLVADVAERVDHRGVELRAGALVDDLASTADGHGRTIRAIRGQRVEGVGDREDPRRLWDVLAAEAVGVAAPVPPLVVVADDQLGVAEEV